MTNENKKISEKIKIYHILILGVILSPLIIINSNYVNNQRAEEKLYKEKSRLFNKIILGRNLENSEDSEEGEDDTKSKIEEVCERGSEELVQYYKTGNLADIDLKEDEKIKCEDKEKDYLKAIINILKSKLGGEGGEDEEGEGEGEEGGEGNTVDSGRRRNLDTETENDDSENKSEEGGDDDLTNNVITYGKHLLPVLIFLVVALLCIPGWLMCCFCCCCNCCCCCCCKKPCCKIPCFVITFALYALVVAVCFYGLSKSNHIFVGIANTECSILRFVDEVIDGESKETLPKWAGFNGIKGILDDINTKINDMGDDTAKDLEDQIKLIDNDDTDEDKKGQKQKFLQKLKDYGIKFYNSGSFPEDYKKTYTEEGIAGTYVLDLVKKFGRYDESTQSGTPTDSYINAWVTEYKYVAEIADNQMKTANDSFNEILGEKLGDITGSLDDATGSMNDIDSQIGDIKGMVSDTIADNAGTIDEYGKLGVKLVFGVLALIDVAIAVFMLLICFCSGKCCTKCCCCRCICKLFTHILWNILALLMIIVFLIGSLFALIGKIGEDAMSVISFIVSEDNLGKDKETILVNDVKNYLEVCINGDGEIAETLGFDKSSMDRLDDIKYAQSNITYAKNEFESKLQMVTYANITGELELRRQLKSPLFSLLPVVENDNTNPLIFGVLLKTINDYSSSQNKKEEWTYNCASDQECGTGNSDDGISTPHEEICFKAKKCLPYNRDWIQTDTSNDIKKNAEIITDMNTIIEKAFEKSTPAGTYNHFNESLGDLGNSYFAFLNQYIIALTKFNDTIDNITISIKKYTGDDAGVFSFINCNFIGKNLKVMLKFLKEALGGDVYTIGVCLILVGCSLALSISFTILLIVVINTDIDNNKKKDNIPEYQLNSGGRVIAYK